MATRLEEQEHYNALMSLIKQQGGAYGMVSNTPIPWFTMPRSSAQKPQIVRRQHIDRWRKANYESHTNDYPTKTSSCDYRAGIPASSPRRCWPALHSRQQRQSRLDLPNTSLTSTEFVCTASSRQRQSSGLAATVMPRPATCGADHAAAGESHTVIVPDLRGGGIPPNQNLDTTRKHA